jgi:hypothetical protein
MLILGPEPLSALRDRQRVIQYPARPRPAREPHPTAASDTPAVRAAAEALADPAPVTLAEARVVIDRVNERVYGGTLPRYRLRLDRDLAHGAETRVATREIALHPGRVSRDILPGVLIHEALHVALEDPLACSEPVPPKDCHGASYRELASTLDPDGAPYDEYSAEAWLPSAGSWALKAAAS